MKDVNDADTFNIFIATDNHLGYKEADAVRGDDSFNAMEEIFQMAGDFDMLVLGGDLFHDNKPTRHCLHRTIAMFRKHCLKDKAIKFNVVSDPAKTFKAQTDVNFRDPHFAVGLPVFIIHGNHDDPLREGMETPLSALDILQASNLLNYFGTTDSLERIDVHPILMTKGRTKIALYGLGNVGDERLNRLFAANKVVFHKPPNFESYFRICVMHQNRDNTGRGPRNCVKDEMIPSFIDLTIWGHEHENQGPPTKRSSNGDGFNVQPGSSVATSLTEAESRSKGVALLQVKRRHFCWTPFPLKSVRPFKYVDVESDELKRRFGNPNDPDLEQDIQHFIEEKVSRTLAELKDEDLPNDLLPLIRIRIDLTDYKGVTIQPHRLGMAFKDSVANPEDMILVRRRRDAKPVSKEDYPDVQEALRKGGDDDGGEFDQEGLNQIILSSFRGEGDKLSVLLEHSLTDAMQEFAIKEVKSAIRDNVDARIKCIQRKLYRNKDLNINEIDTAIAETTNEDRKIEEAKVASQSSGVRIDDDEDDADRVGHRDAGGGAPANSGRGGRLSDSDDSDGGLSTVLRRGKPTSAAHHRGRNGRGGRAVNSDDDGEEEFEEAAPARNRKRKEQHGGGAGVRKRGRAEKSAKSSSKTTTIQSLFARSQNKQAAATKSKPRSAVDAASDSDSVHSGGARKDKRISLRESDEEEEEEEEEEEDVISQASTVSADSRASSRSRRGRTATALSQASTVGVRDTPADALESDDDDAMSRGSRRSTRTRGRQGAARRRAAAARKSTRDTAMDDSDEDAELQAALSLSAATSVAGSEFTAKHQVANSQVSGVSSQVIDLSLADSDEDDVVQPPPRPRSTRRRRR